VCRALRLRDSARALGGDFCASAGAAADMKRTPGSLRTRGPLRFLRF
jgi:hypothetical protein